MKNFFHHQIKKLREDMPSLLILIIFVALSSLAILKPGFFRTIDDITPVRIQYMAKELARAGWIQNFPIRLSGELAHGYGYPLYLFYAPLTYYAGALVMLIVRVHSVIATKAVYLFPLVLGPFLCYWAARQILKPLPALVVACIYTLFPFRGYDSYIRGGVGEAWAMAYIPGAFGGIFYSAKKGELGLLIFSLFFSLTILSHNISTILFVPLFLLYGLVFYTRSRKYWLYFFLALGMTAFFWLPSAYYLPIVKVNYSNQNTGQLLHFLEPISNLFRMTLPYRGDDRYSILFILYFFIVYIAQTVKSKISVQKNNYNFLFFSLVSLICFSVLFIPTQILWEITMPITRLLQFPWRTLIILSFTLPLAVGLAVQKISKGKIQIVLIVTLLISSFYHLSAFKPKEYSFFYEYKAEDTGPCATSWGDEYLPIWVKDCISNPATTVAYFSEKQNKITVTKDESVNLHMKVQSKSKSNLYINKYYFPGYQAYVDERKTTIDYPKTQNGIFSVPIPEGSHDVVIRFSKTPVMLLADILSLLAIGLFLFRYKQILTSQSVSSGKVNS